ARRGPSPVVEGMSRRMASDGPRVGSVSKTASPPVVSGGRALPIRPGSELEGMSANKSVSQDDGPQTHGPRPARPEAAAVPSVPVQEKVLAEISHESGNFFHKLYYWSDHLREQRTRRPPDSTATEMLERTIRNFEEFLKMALEYFHPVQLSCLRMGVADVMTGLLNQTRGQLNGTPLTAVELGDWDGAAVMIDPGRFSQALLIAVRHLMQQVGAESSIRVAVVAAERGGERGVEIGLALHDPASTSPLFQTAAAGVEWALAEKVVELHGGEL